MKKPALIFLTAVAGCWLAIGSLRAGEPVSGAAAPTDKSGFSLWNPVPESLMREMSTDRPDQTESPYTVDAGHWQFEMDFFNFSKTREDGARIEEWNVAPLNVKVGLFHNVDLQMVFGGWIDQKTKAAGLDTSSADGIGDLTVRLKTNLWGNDGGETALALMPFVKIPLGSDEIGNDEVEGGLIVPFAWKPGGWWGLGLMTEVDVVADDSGGGHHLEWLNSVTVGFDVSERVGAYLELVGILAEAGGWSAQFDTGLTFALTDNIQLDAGCNFRITGEVPDYQPFAGISVRF